MQAKISYPTIVKLLTSATEVSGTGVAIAGATNSDEVVSSVIQGAAGLVEEWGPAGLAETAEALGEILAGYDALQATWDSADNGYQLFKDTQSGASATQIAQDQAALSTSTSKLAGDLYHLGCTAVAVGATPLAGAACVAVADALDT